jgi:hypothetical protein
MRASAVASGPSQTVPVNTAAARMHSDELINVRARFFAAVGRGAVRPLSLRTPLFELTERSIAIATARGRNPWPRRHIAVRAAQPSLPGIWLCPVGDLEPLFGSLRFGTQGIGVVGLVGVG